jgi:hypothetical protein
MIDDTMSSHSDNENKEESKKGTKTDELQDDLQMMIYGEVATPEQILGKHKKSRAEKRRQRQLQQEREQQA